MDLARLDAGVLDAARKLGGAHLVGGTVRDLTLGAPSLDLDLAVEGDGAAWARRLADELHGTVVEHGAFGTAVVRYGDGSHADVVTARRETYPEPAALPVVEPGSIDDDLRRRDFTVNALALRLDDGVLLDPTGGGRDLASKTIRVLHDRSFEDDPTRIFRAVRYESRLGFRMDDRTEELARSALPLVSQLSGPRVREELVALLGEETAPASLDRMAELGLDGALDLEISARGCRPLVERIWELNERYGADAPRWRLALEVLLFGGGYWEWLERLALRRRDAELVDGALRGEQLLRAKVVSHEREPAEVFALADLHAPDAPLLALTVGKAPPLEQYFERLRAIRLEVSGDDLAALGVAEGPRVGEILAELRRRKLNGELDGREAELAAARELAG